MIGILDVLLRKREVDKLWDSVFFEKTDNLEEIIATIISCEGLNEYLCNEEGKFGIHCLTDHLITILKPSFEFSGG